MFIQKLFRKIFSKNQTRHSLHTNSQLKKIILTLNRSVDNAKILADFKGYGNNYHLFLKDFIKTPEEDMKTITQKINACHLAKSDSIEGYSIHEITRIFNLYKSFTEKQI